MSVICRIWVTRSGIDEPVPPVTVSTGVVGLGAGVDGLEGFEGFNVPPDVRGRDVPDVVHVCVCGITRARGVSDVAVGEDDRQIDCCALRVRRELGALGVHRRSALGIESGHAELPTEELADGVERRLRRLDGGVVAHHRDTGGVLVESTRVCTLNCLVESSCAAFEGLTVLVDEDVVSDVAPAERLCVVGVDRADDAGRFGLRVVVATCGVVNGRATDEVVVGGGVAAK